MASSSAFDNGGGVEGTKGTYGVVGVDLEPLGLADAIRSQQAMYSLLTQVTIVDFFNVGIGVSPVGVRGVVDAETIDWSNRLSDLAGVRVEGMDEHVEVLALE
jgi:hypothetical protein